MRRRSLNATRRLWHSAPSVSPPATPVDVRQGAQLGASETRLLCRFASQSRQAEWPGLDVAVGESLASRSESYPPMRALRSFRFLGLVPFAFVAPAYADSMDPAIERLVTNAGDCRTTTGAINLPTAPGVYQPCQTDEASFRRLVSQYAFAFAPTAMHSARTTGLGGFHLSLEAAYTGIESKAQYWKNGTRGADDPSTGQASVVNKTPQSVLQLYSVKFRKSFGFGLEFTGVTGIMPKTSMWSAGVDARLSLLEGFRRHIPGSLPDVAVGGGVRTITGASQFQLTIASVDAQVSKPIAIADTTVFTPWIGYQYLWIFADSNIVDLTPATDATRLCGYSGQALPGQVQAASPDSYDGQVICRNGGTNADFDNNRIFKKARLERQRLLLGFNIRHETLMFGAQYILDMVPPDQAQNESYDKTALKGMPRQWTGVVELGLMF